MKGEEEWEWRGSRKKRRTRRRRRKRIEIEREGDDTPVESRLLTGANGLPNNRRPSMNHRSSTGLQLLFRSLKNNSRIVPTSFLLCIETRNAKRPTIQRTRRDAAVAIAIAFRPPQKDLALFQRSSSLTGTLCPRLVFVTSIATRPVLAKPIRQPLVIGSKL